MQEGQLKYVTPSDFVKSLNINPYIQQDAQE